MRIEFTERTDLWTYRGFVKAEEIAYGVVVHGQSAITRRVVNINRGDSLSALLHRTDANGGWFRLVKQLRVSTMSAVWGGSLPASVELGESDAFLELPAIVSAADEPVEQALGRLATHEAGAEPAEHQLVSRFFPSPGACSERVSLYYVRIGAQPGQSRDANVESVDLRPAEFLRRIESGAISDVKCIAAAEWIRRPDVRRRFNLEG
jgi:hypothetical protein